jgi:hypothetical protein
MTEQRFYSPLKIGLFTVVLSYFLFTLHAMFVLTWIGEWQGLPEPTATWILITDISAGFTLVFRFVAGIIAFAAITFFLMKRNLSTPTAFKVLKWILILEALYWLGLLPSGIWGAVAIFGFQSDLALSLSLFITSGLPCMVSAIAIPVALFKLALKLNPNKSMEGAIKWGLISGTVYVLVFWLNNTGMWIVTAMSKGTEYITAYPQNLLSFGLTTVGLLALTIFTAYFTKKSIGTETIEKLKIRTIGAIILSLGMYFLWNYLTWIFFGGDYLWSDWYAWFLGHNLDLWILALPLIGLPLLFKQQDTILSKKETP